MTWRGAYSEDGHYLIQEANPRHTGREFRLWFAGDGGPPFDRMLCICNTRREAKAAAEAHAREVTR